MLQVRIEPLHAIMELRLHKNKQQPPNAVVLSLIKCDEPRFETFVSGRQILSKLLRVNRESREETLQFYRVHIPCTFEDETKENQGSHTLYFNPEFDFLQITPSLLIEETLLDFIYRLKTQWDPHHIGLLNMAIDFGGTMRSAVDWIEPSKFRYKTRKALEDVFTGLHEVFFVHTTGFGYRLLNWKSGLGNSEGLFNRSYPIYAHVPTFKRFKTDPRPVRDDLRKTVFERDLRTIHDWHRMLAKLRVSAPQIKYKLFLRRSI